ncbi:hypothetical protein [Propionispora vibrioides]|jgi:hypothetical protein|uniref:Uncharacterized protein n=1 Tax=Propionispora vibrioides TaxID=112903 RepID=A0A1H8SCG0_9FIRM|nr:hypothetical protein [Propionispora vibrioides]SEO76729.1 hypothetical protein SAMN04490178_10510 [Propionispora vibrioides]
MFQQTNPFLQHAINHGQSLIAEMNKARSLSQDIVSACDSAMMSMNAGNTQNAINSVQSIRNMATQVAQSTQLFNQAINERLDMSSYMLNHIQQKIGELSGAIQSLKASTAHCQSMNWGQYPNQYGNSSAHQMMPGQFGSSMPQQ